MTTVAGLPLHLVAACAWSARQWATPLADISGARAYGQSCGLCLDAGAVAALNPQTREDVLKNENGLDVCGSLAGAVSGCRLAAVLRGLNLPALLVAEGVPPGEVWFYAAGRVGGLASGPAGLPAPDMIMGVGG